MTKDLFIYHHLGLGDHYACNGMVRELIKNVHNAVLFCKEHNKPTVEAMYKDCNNLSFIVGDDNTVNNFLHNKANKVVVGDYAAGFYRPSGLHSDIGDLDFVHGFYRQANVPLDCRWSSWYYERDYTKEDELMSVYSLTEYEPYIFLHDDESRGLYIDKSKLRKDIRIVSPKKGYTDNALNYLKMMECAEEIHCIDSSFRILCEHINTNKLFFHRYARNTNGWGVPYSKKEWVVYE